MIFKTAFGNQSYAAWYLLPTIRFGLWDHREYTSKNHGGFLGLTFLKFDACLMWTVTPKKEKR
jgi:hypothetical protein